MKIIIHNKKKYSSFKIKVTKFLVKNSWKKVKKIEVGDYVIVLDSNLPLHFLQNRQVIGYMPNGKILVSGNSHYSAFNTVSVTMKQCEKWNPELHTVAWREKKRKINLIT